MNDTQNEAVVAGRFLPKALTLAGLYVKLEPLAPGHAEGLFIVARDEEIWRYLPCAPIATMEEMRHWVQQALEDQATRRRIPFAIINRADGEVAGSTSYLDIRPHDRGLEIGWTWLGKEHQRGAVNTECKYLLLRHAFEDLGAVRVQLKTDSRNERSQRAIERIGGEREGVLRRHMTLWNGFVRDTVMYSFIDTEWPEAKQHLQALLHRAT
jgi:RimJ/RimL family protein N-acetyltransferase